ncbi:nucleoside diphosphate kinase regulator [Vulgatibacter sp.]|uniref:nucleoside diphosphate kinase regulator n=1 Tax=Vulgatibacter sp. TaxID=1971226 RepID=UPI0035612DD3
MERSIVVTQQDLGRLHALIEGVAAERNLAAAEALEAELARAQVVAPEEIPADVVTMNSRVRFVDETNGSEREATLVYPQDASAAEGRISILAPIGAALIGLRAGDSIDWPMPNGRSKRLRIVEVLWQPEAAGQFDL